MLAAQIDLGPHGLRQLFDRGHLAVDGNAAAAVGANAAAHDAALYIVGPHEEASLDLKRSRPLAHGARIGALADQQLDGRQQRGLSRARLARQNRKATRELDRGLLDQGNVLHMQLVEHYLPTCP